MKFKSTVLALCLVLSSSVFALSASAPAASSVKPFVAATSAPASAASAPVKRKQSTRVAFVRANACPATGKTVLPCPGYIIDHVKPLCAGGADSVANMQWQTKADSLAKDKLERAQCKALKK